MAILSEKKGAYETDCQSNRQKNQDLPLHTCMYGQPNKSLQRKTTLLHSQKNNSQGTGTTKNKYFKNQV